MRLMLASKNNRMEVKMVKTKLGLKNVYRGFKSLQRNAEQGFIVIF